MARKKEEIDDELDEYEDDEEYDDDYEDDEYYDDEPRRNPLKPFVIALLVLLVLMAAIIGLLYTRLQTANDKVAELNASLEASRTEINNLLSERTGGNGASAAAPASDPAATPEPTPEPTATPEPTPEPTATPEPTPEPTATPAPLLRDSVTDEMLGGILRPNDESWYEQPKPGAVDAAYLLALHWGPSMEWNEVFALNRDTKVEVVAEQKGWKLIRTEDGRYGWCVGNLIRDA